MLTAMSKSSLEFVSEIILFCCAIIFLRWVFYRRYVFSIDIIPKLGGEIRNNTKTGKVSSHQQDSGNSSSRDRRFSQNSSNFPKKIFQHHQSNLFSYSNNKSLNDNGVVHKEEEDQLLPNRSESDTGVRVGHHRGSFFVDHRHSLNKDGFFIRALECPWLWEKENLKRIEDPKWDCDFHTLSTNLSTNPWLKKKWESSIQRELNLISVEDSRGEKIKNLQLRAASFAKLWQKFSPLAGNMALILRRKSGEAGDSKSSKGQEEAEKGGPRVFCAAPRDVCGTFSDFYNTKNTDLKIFHLSSSDGSIRRKKTTVEEISNIIRKRLNFEECESDLKVFEKKERISGLTAGLTHCRSRPRCCWRNLDTVLELQEEFRRAHAQRRVHNHNDNDEKINKGNKFPEQLYDGLDKNEIALSYGVGDVIAVTFSRIGDQRLAQELRDRVQEEKQKRTRSNNIAGRPSGPSPILALLDCTNRGPEPSSPQRVGTWGPKESLAECVEIDVNNNVQSSFPREKELSGETHHLEPESFKLTRRAAGGVFGNTTTTNIAAAPAKQAFINNTKTSGDPKNVEPLSGGPVNIDSSKFVQLLKISPEKENVLFSNIISEQEGPTIGVGTRSHLVPVGTNIVSDQLTRAERFVLEDFYQQKFSLFENDQAEALEEVNSLSNVSIKNISASSLQTSSSSKPDSPKDSLLLKKRSTSSRRSIFRKEELEEHDEEEELGVGVAVSMVAHKTWKNGPALDRKSNERDRAVFLPAPPPAASSLQEWDISLPPRDSSKFTVVDNDDDSYNNKKHNNENSTISRFNVFCERGPVGGQHLCREDQSAVSIFNFKKTKFWPVRNFVGVHDHDDPTAAKLPRGDFSTWGLLFNLRKFSNLWKHFTVSSKCRKTQKCKWHIQGFSKNMTNCQFHGAPLLASCGDCGGHCCFQWFGETVAGLSFGYEKWKAKVNSVVDASFSGEAQCHRGGGWNEFTLQGLNADALVGILEDGSVGLRKVYDCCVLIYYSSRVLYNIEFLAIIGC